MWDVLREAKTGRAAVVLFRHARAPGTSDPPGFKIGDCATQRNLDAAGRAQAQRVGTTFRDAGVMVGRVLASQWCRSTETAEIAFPGLVTPEPAFNSFFDAPEREAGQTREARAILADWRGAGVMVVVTHQVNITALTGIAPRDGEGVVVTISGSDLRVVGRIQP